MPSSRPSTSFARNWRRYVYFFMNIISPFDAALDSIHPHGRSSWARCRLARSLALFPRMERGRSMESGEHSVAFKMEGRASDKREKRRALRAPIMAS